MIKNKYFIKITGKNPKSFLRSLYKMHVELEKIKYHKEYIIIVVDEDNYQKIKKIKTSYELDVVNLEGIVKWKFLLKKYFLFVVILLLGFLLLLGLSNLIFDIEVIHTKEEIRSLIENELNNQGIKKFNFKVSYEKKEEITSNILKKYKDRLEWLEIDTVGCKYIVKVEERKLNTPSKDSPPQDIVAKKDGVILKIEASSGTVMKKKNDFVKKGDVIITGVIKNQDTLMELVPAKGIVYAETWYKSQVEMPLQYREEYLTGKNKTVFQLSFLSHTFNLFDFSPFDYSRDKIDKIVENKLFPFSIQLVKQEELKVIDEVYTREEASTKAVELAKEKLKRRLGVNDEIIHEKTLKFTEKESKIIVEVFFKVKEDITSSQIIDEKKILENEEIKEQ